MPLFVAVAAVSSPSSSSVRFGILAAVLWLVVAVVAVVVRIARPFLFVLFHGFLFQCLQFGS